MSHYKLVGLPASRAARNLWLLEELSVPYESDPIHYTDQALKQPPYTDWNPNGAIPFLLIDGKPMFESLAINLYLASKHGQFCGQSAEDSGLCTQWSFWAATTLEPVIGQWAYHTIFLPELERKPEMVTDAIEKLHKPLKVLEGVLSKSAYLIGDEFTVADLNTAAVAWRVLSTTLAAEYPVTSAWITKCWARPAAVRVRVMRGDVV